MEKSCIVCESTFKVPKGHYNKVYCSTNCRINFYQRKKIGLSPKINEILCPVCDANFKPSRYGQLYCSKKCRNKFYHRRKTGLNIKNKIINCIVCKKSFVCKNIKDNKYCSKKCCNVANRRKKLNIPINSKSLRSPIGKPFKHKSGYLMRTLKDHPNSTKYGRIMDHVVIMSEHLGRPLKKKETVHHKNGIRDDNRIENLELWDSSHPPGQRVQDKIDFYKDFLESYGYIVTKKESFNKEQKNETNE